MKSNSIDRIMVGPNNPHNNNALWVDTSGGEKQAVLKYKGNPIVGNNTGQGGGGASFGSLDSIPKIQFTQDIPQESFWDKVGKVTGLNGSFPLSLNAIDTEGGTAYNMVMYLQQVDEYTSEYSTVTGTYSTPGQNFVFILVFSNEDKTEGYVYRN